MASPHSQMALSTEQHEDAIVVCASIAATCSFFLTTPIMCSTVASEACYSLNEPLQQQRTYRRLLAKGGGVNNTSSTAVVSEGCDSSAPPQVSSPSSSSASCAVFGRIDKHHDEELVVRIFHCGFLVFLACQRWRSLKQKKLEDEADKAEEEGVVVDADSGPALARRRAGFVECCGGVVKLDRSDLLAKCFEAVCASLVTFASTSLSFGDGSLARGSSPTEGATLSFLHPSSYPLPSLSNTTNGPSSVGSMFNYVQAMRERDCGALREFLIAVMIRHPQSAAAVGAVRLILLLGGGLLLPRCLTATESGTTSDDGADGEEDAEAAQAFVSALIQLISNGDCEAAYSIIADRTVSTAAWYATDIDVLLEGLRMNEGREPDAAKKAVLSKAIRVVLRDMLPSAASQQNDGADECSSSSSSIVSAWLARMALSKDYSSIFESRGVTVSTLVDPSLGRMAIVDTLGVEDWDDADTIYRVLSEAA